MVVNSVIYWYYPEGRKDKSPGQIRYDRADKTATVIRCAENDYKIEISAEELNEMADAINRMKMDRGDTDYVPMTDQLSVYYAYGEHARRDIWRRALVGAIPETGTVMWY